MVDFQGKQIDLENFCVISIVWNSIKASAYLKGRKGEGKMCLDYPNSFYSL